MGGLVWRIGSALMKLTLIALKVACCICGNALKVATSCEDSDMHNWQVWQPAWLLAGVEESLLSNDLAVSIGQSGDISATKASTPAISNIAVLFVI